MSSTAADLMDVGIGDVIGYHPADLYTNATVRCSAPVGGAGVAAGRYSVSLVQL